MTNIFYILSGILVMDHLEGYKFENAGCLPLFWELVGAVFVFGWSTAGDGDIV